MSDQTDPTTPENDPVDSDAPPGVNVKPLDPAHRKALLIGGSVIGVIVLIVAGFFIYKYVTKPEPKVYEGSSYDQIVQWNDETNQANREGVKRSLMEITDMIPTMKSNNDEDFIAACGRLGDQVEVAQKADPAPDEKANELLQDALNHAEWVVPNCEKQGKSGEKLVFTAMTDDLFAYYDKMSEYDERIREIQVESGMKVEPEPTVPEFPTEDQSSTTTETGN